MAVAVEVVVTDATPLQHLRAAAAAAGLGLVPDKMVETLVAKDLAAAVQARGALLVALGVMDLLAIA